MGIWGNKMAKLGNPLKVLKKFRDGGKKIRHVRVTWNTQFFILGLIKTDFQAKLKNSVDHDDQKSTGQDPQFLKYDTSKLTLIWVLRWALSVYMFTFYPVWPRYILFRKQFGIYTFHLPMKSLS